MNNKNELNDIILNKGGSASSNKKIILAVATLGIILIIVVMLMNSLNSNGTDNLPQAVLPPEPTAQVIEEDTNEPLFEEVEVIEEESDSDVNLDAIAQKLKEESMQEEEVIVVAPKPVKKIAPKKVTPKKVIAPVTKSTSGIKNYIQVGSFSKYQPNKKFLKSITNLGFDYKFHKITKNSKTFTKVLVGPFSTLKAAKDARRVLRAKVEPGAFLVKL